MSYDIYLREPGTDKVVEFEEPHQLTGGTYAVGGTTDAWLNVTYNYGDIFRRVLGSGGIRSIYGMTGEKSLTVLQAAIDQLGDDEDPDYWAATEGNAKKALVGLKALASMRQDGVWDGD